MDLSDANTSSISSSTTRLSVSLLRPQEPEHRCLVYLCSAPHRRPGGKFLGAVVATIRTEYLEEFYKAITLQESGSVTLCAGTVRSSLATPIPKG